MATRTIKLDTKEIETIVTLLESCQGQQKLAARLRNACKTIKVSSAKNKGRQFQQDVCMMISRATGLPYTPGVDGLISSRGMGQNGTDVVLLGEAERRFPFAVECKNCESLDLVGAVGQAKANARDGKQWVVFHRRKSLKEDVVVLDAEVFMRMTRHDD